ncbi:MAG: VanZ family protein [Nitrospirae bacterium]|nr:MAG: VanZ family protein [Nitrospirota bacterium]
MIISYHTLLVVNVESIHFFQYALLAIPFYALTGSYGQSILLITILGAIDEGYQYFFLYPDWKYLDFNDIILNLLGGAAGLMLILLTTSKETNMPARHLFSGKIPLVIGLTIFVTLLPFITGLAGVTAGDGEKSPPGIVLIREKPPEGFWIEMKWGKRYHILSPAEGTIITIMLIGVYALLDRRPEQG